jgi:hypothetical protein
MGGKSDKCCCGCQGICIGLGSRFVDCTACVEAPRYWNFGSFIGNSAPSGPIFACCTNLKFQFTNGTLLHVSGGACQWQSPVVYCEDGTTAQWTLTVPALTIGLVTLVVNWSDGRQAKWVNIDVWNCLCPNKMKRVHGLDDKVVDLCGIPELICLNPVSPCCNTRISPLPRTLRASLLNLTNCPCVGGTFTLTWDATLLMWVGSGPYCTSTFTLRIACFRNGIDVTDWNGDVQWTGSTLPCTDSAQQSIGVGIVGGFTISDCEPIHLRFVITTTGGCCGLVASQVQVDIVEV